MFYLLSITAIQWQSLFIVFSAMKKFFKHSEGRSNQLILITCVLISATLLVSPVMFELVAMSDFESGKGVALSSDNNPIWLLLLGSVITLCLYTYRLYYQHKAGTSTFLSVGPNFLGILIACYMAFTAIDHLIFYQGDDAGFLNWSFFRDYKEISDVNCDSEIMLIKGMKSGTITYRCPQPNQLLLGQLSSNPYLPWPGYREGTSTELVPALEQLQAESKNLSADQP